MNNLQLILDGLMRRYKERVPDVDKVIPAMVQEGLIRSGADIENDHIAFRTMGVPHLGIQSLEKYSCTMGIPKGIIIISPKRSWMPIGMHLLHLLSLVFLSVSCG